MCPGPPVHPVDTTGAGDIFMGSAVAQLLRAGRRPEELDAAQLRHIAAAACTEASLSTERPAASAASPRRPQP